MTPPEARRAWARVHGLPRILAYGAAVAIPGAAVAIRLAMDPVWGTRLPYIFFFAGVALSAWVGGLGPGLVTTAISLIAAAYYWIEPIRSFRFSHPADLLGLAVFAITGAVISSLNEAWRRANARLLASEKQERAARVGAELAARQLEYALEAGQLGTWRFDVATGESDWAPRVREMFGYAPSGTFPGAAAAFEDTIDPRDRDRVRQVFADAIAGAGEYRVEFRIVRQDGAPRWLEALGRVYRDASGKPEFLAGICADITDRKAAQEQVQLAITASPAAMVIVGADGKIRFANARTAELLGYSVQEMLGMPVDVLVPGRAQPHHGQLRASFLANPQARAMGAGRDLTARRKDGTEVQVEIGLTPIQTSDGTIVVAAITDITARKRIEESLREASHAAREANRLKDQFLATLSHELRTPLQSILTYAQILSSRDLSDVQLKQAVLAIDRSTRTQTRLIDSLLDLTRIEAGKLDLRLEQLDLLQVVESAADVVRPEAGRKAITLQIHAPAQPLVVVGDSARLQQVVWNLLTNAIKFTPDGGRVDIRLMGEGSQARIVIADNGRGIDPDFLPRIFERFTQASGQGGGLGLGLAIVEELVKAHGGTVRAESPGPSQGSTFTVTLPLAPTVEPPAQRAVSPNRAEPTPSRPTRAIE